MKTQGCLFCRILPLGLAVAYSILQVRGEMCAAVTRGAAAENHIALHDKAIAAFRAECRVKKQCQPEELKSCSFVTEPESPYSFTFVIGPLGVPFRLNFEVRAEFDALIALAEETTEQSIFADIAIGAAANTNSQIRACYSHTCPPKVAEHEEAGLLSDTESRPFWIEYNQEGVVTVGKGGQQRAFLEWNAGTYHKKVASEVHVGISTWEEAHGDWVFYQYCD